MTAWDEPRTATYVRCWTTLLFTVTYLILRVNTGNTVLRFGREFKKARPAIWPHPSRDTSE